MKKYILGILLALTVCLLGCNSESMTEEETIINKNVWNFRFLKRG